MCDRRIGLAVLVVASVAILWWFSRSSPARRADSDAAPAGPPHVETGSLEVIVEPASERQQAGDFPPNMSIPSPAGSDCGTVVDATFERPLFGWIVPDFGDPAVSDARTGSFRLTASAASRSSAWVFASGCIPARIDVANGRPDPCIVRLVPELAATIVVVDDAGHGVPDVPVEWRPEIERPELAQDRWWVDSRFHLASPARTARSDETGTCRIATAVPLIAAVGRAPHRSGQWIEIDPGSTTIVRIADGFWIEVVDANSGAPVAGLDLDVLSCAGAGRRSAPVETDAHGRVHVTAPSFPLDVRLPGSAAWQGSLLPTSDCARTTGIGGDVQTFVRFERSPGESPCLIQLRSCGWTLRLVDRTTGAAIDGSVRIERRGTSDCDEPRVLKFCTVHSPRIEGDAEFTFRSAGGLLTLPCLVELDHDLARGRHTYGDTVLLAAGYVPRTLELPDFEAASGSGDDVSPRQIELDPAPSRSLRVVHADGTPFAESVWIHSAEHDVLVWKAAGRADGVHGPFDWFGGDLRVDVGNDGRWAFTLQAQEIERSNVLQLTLSSVPGVLVVEDVPDEARGAQVVATSGFGVERVEHIARIAGSNRLVFDALAPGTYLVGPVPWVRAVETASYAGALGGVTANVLRTQVQPGQTSIVRWNRAWRRDAPVEGRVRIIGRPGRDVFLLGSCVPMDAESPLEAQRVPRAHFTRSSPRISLDADGRYSLSAGGPLVTSIAVCLSAASNWGGFEFTIVRTFEPGASVAVAFGEVAVRWTGGGGIGTLPIEYRTDASASGGSPIRRVVRRTWDTATPCVLADVPTDVAEIHVGPWRVPVRVTAGHRAEMVLDERGPSNQDLGPGQPEDR